mmetsp:Transcript_5321/g.9577  ORF Transcript_5321/g.9577 Transcript_5321/m.9577 type:complete len:159 (+) Transcript_5321:51-527(+)
MADAEILAAREKLKSRFGSGASRVGGVRRKKQVTHRASSNDNKKLQSSLKRLGVNPIGAASEVVFLMEDEQAMVFGQGVKLQANISANTFVISGNHVTKPQSEVGGLGLSGVDAAQMAELQRLMSQQGLGAQAPAAGDAEDDDLPELVENFEEVSESA